MNYLTMNGLTCFSDSVLWKTRSGARINYSVRVHKALFHLFQFGYSEGYCSTCHTTQYLGLECPAVALSLTSILSFKGMVS